MVTALLAPVTSSALDGKGGRNDEASDGRPQQHTNSSTLRIIPRSSLLSLTGLHTCNGDIQKPRLSGPAKVTATLRSAQAPLRSPAS